MTKAQVKAQEDLFDDHIAFIHENFGEDVDANYGWSQDENAFTSKIYSNTRQYVSSVRHEDGSIEHWIESD